MLSNLNQAHLLVTGGAGFMGSAFIRYVLSQPGFTGHISNLDLLTYAGNLDNLKEVEEDSRYAFYKGDVRDRSVLEEIHKEKPLTAIVHFAAETHVDRSITDPTPFLETNILGTCNLLEFVRTHPNIHFHHISTDEVYGALGADGIFTEETPYRPNSPYSASKASSDHFVRAYAVTYDLSTTLSHASNNYGPGQYPEKFIPLMIQNALGKKPLPVYGKGENIREWLFVEDHSRAIWTILEEGKKGEVYNIGGGNEMKNIDLLRLILKVAEEMTAEKNLEALITFVTDRPGHDFRYAMDGTKVSSLGFTPQWSLEAGLRATMEILL
ncbi:dTDP-glucose 4,6-dehydratase [Candidatus Neptunochlamydia vexilliferae]|uniref:dTDP-glucose 4,6-dehydratase n=1 Tax=Candidatus Neptunichlamydia vexilliferae TaxID=1651774 RepID=UPI0018916350|nr:dTDP-glucose 4,6-dehydratase [Candidatus Neptunochlamydia vexilliferae]